jgi:hypothetical protein
MNALLWCLLAWAAVHPIVVTYTVLAGHRHASISLARLGFGLWAAYLLVA